MRKTFIVGDKVYKFKKDAILHYKAVLNSYNFGQSLDEDDFNDLIDLLYIEHESYTEVNEISILEDELITSDFPEGELVIIDIKVSQVQFKTKCFEIFYSDDTSQYISYLMIINNTKYTPEKLFNVACRNSIQSDIKSVKQDYFDNNSVKGQVKCQETGILSKWTELAVDHRQPNTFSIIVDRFKEINRIDLQTVEYSSNDQNLIVFQDNSWTENFREYHREKASLRIVRNECNSSRSGLARLKRTSKDLTIR